MMSWYHGAKAYQFQDSFKRFKKTMAHTSYGLSSEISTFRKELKYQYKRVLIPLLLQLLNYEECIFKKPCDDTYILEQSKLQLLNEITKMKCDPGAVQLTESQLVIRTTLENLDKLKLKIDLARMNYNPSVPERTESPYLTGNNLEKSSEYDLLLVASEFVRALENRFMHCIHIMEFIGTTMVN